MPPRVASLRHMLLSRLALLAGAVLLALSVLSDTVEDSVFDPDSFGDHAAQSLGDPRVARFAGDRITQAVLDQSPDLTAVRPILLATAEGVAGSEAFRGLVRGAARSFHKALFAEGTRRIVLSVPDVGVLLGAAFERASPELAKKIPESLHAIVASLDQNRATELVVDLWTLRGDLRWMKWSLFAAAMILLLAGGLLASDRRRGVVGVGVALLAAGALVALGVPLGSAAVASFADEALWSDALRGLWGTYMVGLTSWGLFLAGVGVLFAAAGSSLLEDFEPMAWLREVQRKATTPPRTKLGRAGLGTLLLAMGGVAAIAPQTMVTIVVVAGGFGLGILGSRELFRLILESVEASPVLARATRTREGRSALEIGIVALLILVLGGAAFLISRPSDNEPPSYVHACNGYEELCDRPVDEVVFPGAHNAMSNTSIPDWMFPHHRAGIAQQLRDGVRALLIDIHYGFPGASRVKTDLGDERPTTQVLLEALGQEGMDAAMRIRETLVGVDEGERGLYFCHGFCEIGAYPIGPTLHEVRNFLIQRPGEVLILVVEDYVSPEDLAKALEESGLADLVYRGPSGPPWPTLRDLVESGQPVVIFLESGRSGVDWLRPAFELIQETPYTFHEPSEFSCRPNRGPVDASLFQINHWIETTPAPRPSNAAIVNARDVLLTRTRECQKKRALTPNIIAVDFYGIGDLFGVAKALNGLTVDR